MRLGVAEASLPRNIGHLVPMLATSIHGAEFNQKANVVAFWLEGVYVAVYPDKVLLNRIESREQAEEVMEQVNHLVTRLAQEKG